MNHAAVMPHALQRQRVALTGKFLSMARVEAQRIIEHAGGQLSTSVSKRTHVLVVGMGGWPLLPNGEVSSALRRAEDLNGRGAQIRILSEEIFLETVGLKQAGPALEKRYAAAEICQLTGVDQAKLRRWEQLGLVRSYEGYFDFQDLISLRTLTELINHDVRPEVIHRSLKGLSSILPGTDRPLAQLQIVMHNSDSLAAELDGCRISAEGQFLLNFDEPISDTSKSIEFGPPCDAEAWFERGHELEEQEQLDEAAEAYRQTIALDPAMPEAFFNLANVLRAQDRPEAALEMLRIAVTLAPSLCEAWYNLADLWEEQEELTQAVDALERALTANPTFADAFYNLAMCCEKLGDITKARRCWTQYLKLDPHSSWADVARQHLIAQG